MLTGRYLTVLGRFGDDAGSYASDLDCGDLLQLTQNDHKFELDMRGHENLLTWSTPVNNGHGMKLWAAEFDNHLSLFRAVPRRSPS